MRRRGFTLIELLVAIGIIVLLSVIALASTRSLRGSLRFSTAVNTTTALLERARSEAIRRGEPVMAAFRPVVIGLRDRNGDGVLDLDELRQLWGQQRREKREEKEEKEVVTKKK